MVLSSISFLLCLVCVCYVFSGLFPCIFSTCCWWEDWHLPPYILVGFAPRKWCLWLGNLWGAQKEVPWIWLRHWHTWLYNGQDKFIPLLVGCIDITSLVLPLDIYGLVVIWSYQFNEECCPTYCLRQMQCLHYSPIGWFVTIFEMSYLYLVVYSSIVYVTKTLTG